MFFSFFTFPPSKLIIIHDTMTFFYSSTSFSTLLSPIMDDVDTGGILKWKKELHLFNIHFSKKIRVVMLCEKRESKKTNPWAIKFHFYLHNTSIVEHKSYNCNNHCRFLQLKLLSPLWLIWYCWQLGFRCKMLFLCEFDVSTMLADWGINGTKLRRRIGTL